MPIAPGTRLGPYEILSALGAGGMGEVYRARDTKLGRDVAIKVLPTSLTSEPDRLARFAREAQVLASLNHPNIAAIYHVEDAEGAPALVMELVGGETLADRIARGPIPIDEALPIAKQIAEALEAAHEQGIIHRDLKPANIKVTPDRRVKVLDFGLAKLAEAPATTGSGPHPLSMSPTITSPALITGVGVLLGTAAYMSPEQAKGRPADKRSDIWAFGCLLFEMLSGKRAFPGDDVSDTLAAILRGDPEWAALQDVPPLVTSLIRSCLQRDSRVRVADISVAIFALDQPLATPSSTVPKRPGRYAAIVVAAIVVVAGFVIIAVRARPEPTSPRVARFAVAVPLAAPLPNAPGDRVVAIAPDGSGLVYISQGRTSVGRALVMRSLDSLDPHVLAGATPGAVGPFFSPDGRWVVFWDGTVLEKVPVGGGLAAPICNLNGSLIGASWGDDGTIVFATSDRATGLLRVDAAGGTPTVVTRPDVQRGEADHVAPHFIPGTSKVVFTVLSGRTDVPAHMDVVDLNNGSRKTVVADGDSGRYVASGHLVYMRNGSLQAMPFDPSTLTATGPAAPVLTELQLTRDGEPSLDVSREGTLAYIRAGTNPARTFVWVDRTGHEEAVALPSHEYALPRLSPDGTRVVVDIREGGNREGRVWVANLSTSALTPLTAKIGPEVNPIWSPDGTRIAFSFETGGNVASVFWARVDSSEPPERLVTSTKETYPFSFSPDGRYLVFRENTSPIPYDLGLLTVDGRKITPLLHDTFNEMNGEISPDGRWMAYVSDESGRDEVYIRPFPSVTAGRWQVSATGGTRPLWNRNGRELFYVESESQLMGVDVGTGPTFSTSAPYVVFKGPYVWAVTGSREGRPFDVSPDGRRFLMMKELPAPTDERSNSIVVVQNWFEELRRLAPAR